MNEDDITGIFRTVMPEHEPHIPDLRDLARAKGQRLRARRQASILSATGAVVAVAAATAFVAGSGGAGGGGTSGAHAGASGGPGTAISTATSAPSAALPTSSTSPNGGTATAGMYPGGTYSVSPTYLTGTQAANYDAELIRVIGPHLAKGQTLSLGTAPDRLTVTGPGGRTATLSVDLFWYNSPAMGDTDLCHRWPGTGCRTGTLPNGVHYVGGSSVSQSAQAGNGQKVNDYNAFTTGTGHDFNLNLICTNGIQTGGLNTAAAIPGEPLVSVDTLAQIAADPALFTSEMRALSQVPGMPGSNTTPPSAATTTP